MSPPQETTNSGKEDTQEQLGENVLEEVELSPEAETEECHAKLRDVEVETESGADNIVVGITNKKRKILPKEDIWVPPGTVGIACNNSQPESKPTHSCSFIQIHQLFNTRGVKLLDVNITPMMHKLDSTTQQMLMAAALKVGTLQAGIEASDQYLLDQGVDQGVTVDGHSLDKLADNSSNHHSSDDSMDSDDPLFPATGSLHNPEDNRVYRGEHGRFLMMHIGKVIPDQEKIHDILWKCGEKGPGEGQVSKCLGVRFPKGELPQQAAYHASLLEEKQKPITESNQEEKERTEKFLEVMDLLSLQATHCGSDIDGRAYNRRIKIGRDLQDLVATHFKQIGHSPLVWLASPVFPTVHINWGEITGSQEGLLHPEGACVGQRDAAFSHSFIYTFNKAHCKDCHGEGAVLVVEILKKDGTPVRIYLRAGPGDVTVIMEKGMSHKVISKCPECGPHQVSVVVSIEEKVKFLADFARNLARPEQSAEEKEEQVRIYKEFYQRRGRQSQKLRKQKKARNRKAKERKEVKNAKKEVAEMEAEEKKVKKVKKEDGAMGDEEKKVIMEAGEQEGQLHLVSKKRKRPNRNIREKKRKLSEKNAEEGWANELLEASASFGL
ncbi:hypothetical protein HDU93_003731 [Gonapodya sp. JEL0774]|nr:hypothetical protein HDU93_003731 [Gonapodya sp. JEL0774]